MNKNPYATPVSDVRPAHYSRSIYGGLRDIKAVSKVVLLLLSTDIFLSMISATISFISGNSFANESTPSYYSLSHIFESMMYIKFTLYLLIVVSFCIWTNKAMKNAWYLRSKHSDDLSGETTMLTPFWAIGWYFVPIAFFWMPLRGMYQIWQITFQGERSTSILKIWWFFWLLSNVATQIANRRVPRTFEDISNLNYVYSVISITWVITALLLIQIIKLVTLTQSKEYIHNQHK